MTNKDLHPKMHLQKSYTPDAQRLLAMMQGWWTGLSLAALAKTHGITRGRASQILQSVGCRTGARCEQVTPDSRRSGPPERAADAMAMLGHWRFTRLTVRQRAAVAWTATGISSRDISKRMGISGQRVRMLMVSARARLLRPKLSPNNLKESMKNNTPIPAMCWDGVIESLTRPLPQNPENSHAD